MSPAATPDDPPFIQRSIPNKGQGLIATRPIPAGTLLISEPPLFTTESLENASTIEQDLAAIVKSLPRDAQRQFLSLHNNFKGEAHPFSNIVRSNGYPLGPSSPIGGIFPLVSRLNHSCLPNAQHAYNAKLQRMLVHAVRDIGAEEEVTLSYLTGGPTTERQRILQQNFRFTCTCELCALPCAQREQSDARLQRAQVLDARIGDAKTVRHQPERALRDCQALREVYAREKVADLRLPRLYYDAFQIVAMHGDAARARVFARRARETRVVCEGEESEEVENLRGLEAEPERFENFGVTKRWGSRAGEGVEGKDGEERFERWLWRERN